MMLHQRETLRQAALEAVDTLHTRFQRVHITYWASHEDQLRN